MNVYGLTYAFTINYGTCLQAYALQNVIEKMDIFGENPKYYLIPISRSPGYFRENTKSVKKLIKKEIFKHSRKQFVSFEKRFMHYASTKDINSFDEYNHDADVFVCGSDVIWNPKFNHEIKRFYLDFSNKYAFSYAASFGQSDVNPLQYPYLKELLPRLNAISVREHQSAEIVKQCISNEEPEVCVDPVLLLKREEWEKVAEKDNQKGRHIFAYSVKTDKLLDAFVKQLSKQTKLKVIYSGGSIGSSIKQGFLNSYTPERWLQLIKDADYVVTDSFHGTAFSVIFRKNFFTIVNGDPHNGFNVRMGDFLTELGLLRRIHSTIPAEIDCSPIDFSQAENRLKEKIAYSLAYLEKNLNMAYQQRHDAEKN